MNNNFLIIYLKTLLVAFICVVIHVFLANVVPIWGYIFSNSDLFIVTKNFLNVLFFSVSLSFLIAISLSINISITKAFLFIINLTASLYGYYALQFGVHMSDELMVTMLFFLEENDVFSSFDWLIFIYTPLIFIPSLLLTSYTLKKFGYVSKYSFRVVQIVRSVFKKITIFFLNILFFILFLLSLYASADINLLAYSLKTVSEQMMPWYLVARKSNINKLLNVYKSDLKLEDYDKFNFKYNATSHEPLIVVLVIGEALRSDKLGVNDYDRDTTEHMRDIQNLFSFKDVISCSTTTAVSLPCMLTNESQDTWIDKFKTGAYTPKYSVAKVFGDVGFDTKWLSSANKDYGMYISKDFHGTQSVLLSNELRRQFLSKRDDFGDLLLVDALDVNVKKNTMLVLGTMGSHRDYYSRYPKDMAKYKPDIGSSIEAINNAYDNTVVYFDQFIFELTNKLKDKNALMIYISDHGESLGENGVFLHGAAVDTAPKEQRLVPMIAWMSDKFIENNPEKYKNIKNWAGLNARSKTQIRHDFVFHSLLDCSGIKSDSNGIDNKLSICSKLIK